MNNKVVSEQEIKNYLKEHQKAKISEMWRDLGFSRQLIQRKLKKLVVSGVVGKSGRPPLVFYYLDSGSRANNLEGVCGNLVSFIDSKYLYVSPLGELMPGFAGFSMWANSIGELKRIEELAIEYKKTIEESKKHFNKYGFIDASERINNTFPEVFLKKVYYLDFYALPKFGKTKLGQLVLYSKQSQKFDLIKEISLIIKPKIEELILQEKIDAVSFIPPTVARNVQFIKELEKILNLATPTIQLKKAYVGIIPVAQKTLSRLEERVENASRTIFTNSSSQKFERVLLIDDAVGSGASLNETAKKLIKEKIAKAVIGFAIVGSYKGFDVIREI